MKKIGIITHYYQSRNYGGNLQAYALALYLNQNGYHAEQISYQGNYAASRNAGSRKLIDWVKLPFRIARSVTLRVVKGMEEKTHHVSARRKQAFAPFNLEMIPHSEAVYDVSTVCRCADDYDIFITGSDQVWNLKWKNPAFFLDFVPSDKKKISYAASIAAESLTDEQKANLRDYLRDFDAISVREKGAVALLSDLTSIPVIHTLDPTFLIDRGQWDRICSPRPVEEDYLFCYFLGENKKERRLAREYARKHQLKLVTIPHAGGSIRVSDIGFGEVRCFDASPADFLSLIKHAHSVFTDSFHAVVFSNLYEKQYYVFNRTGSGEMSSRIQDITELFGTKERFCCTKERENLQYITSLKEIDYSRKNLVFEKLLAESKAFLAGSLGGNTVEKDAGKK